MAAEPRRVTPRSESRSGGNAGFEVIAAAALIALGIIGGSIAMQSRIYLGDPLPSGASADQVLQRVTAAPNVGPIAILFLAIGSAITGLAWLLLRLIHRRFFAPVNAARVWRESFFAALFVVSSAWLQLNRALTAASAAIMLVVLVLVEVFLNIRGA